MSGTTSTNLELRPHRRGESDTLSTIVLRERARGQRACSLHADHRRAALTSAQSLQRRQLLAARAWQGRAEVATATRAAGNNATGTSAGYWVELAAMSNANVITVFAGGEDESDHRVAAEA